MCFSNLPVEFDEEGNPYLADDAEDIERPGESTHDGGAAGDVEVEADPESAYEAIVESLPDGAREHVEGGIGRPTPHPDSDTAEGD